MSTTALLASLKAARSALDAAIAEMEGRPARLIRLGRATLNCRTRRLSVDGRETTLMPTAMAVLWHLIQHRGEICTRNEILDGIWGPDYAGTARSIDVQIASLRKLLEPDPANPTLLVTEHGYGYRLEETK